MMLWGATRWWFVGKVWLAPEGGGGGGGLCLRGQAKSLGALTADV